MASMKILIGCTIPEPVLVELRALGTELIYEPRIDPVRMQQLIDGVGVLVVSRNRVTSEVIATGKTLQMIIRAGADTSHIAVDEASKAGIFVCNCPFEHARAVAELTFGYLLALDRRLVDHHQSDRRRKPAEIPEIEAFGLAGRTLGVLGYGPVEKEIVTRARAFDMSVAAWSPTLLTPEIAAERNILFGARPRDVARQSDMVSVYISPQNQETRVVDADLLNNMRPGAYLVYIGHPAALDLSALVDVADKREIRIAYDFSAPQLTTADIGRLMTRLESLPNVIGTFGLADRTKQARRATADEILRIIREFLVNSVVLNCVNLIEYNPATWQLVLRLRDRVGVLASIMDVLRADGINMEDITSRLFTGGQAAWCIIAVDERPSAEALETIQKLGGVLNLEIRAVV